MKFTEVNAIDCLVVIGLVIGLIMAIFYKMNELSIGIVGVLGGYIGASRTRGSQNKIEKAGNEE